MAVPPCCSSSSSPLHLPSFRSPYLLIHGRRYGFPGIFIGFRNPPSVLLRSSVPRRSSVVAHSRRRRRSSTNPKRSNSEDQVISDGDDADPIEALFNQLEEDLKNDNLDGDELNDDITEEDIARLEKELDDALLEDDELDEISDGLAKNKVIGGEASGEDDSFADEEEEENGSLQKLKTWQLRRLAIALKVGRRKTCIKNLAAELGLERAVVLDALRDPPPTLVMMCATIPDSATQKPSNVKAEPVIGDKEVINSTTIIDGEEVGLEEKIPLHAMRTRWSSQKRLKKVQVLTLERVYARTKRPTNSMISSIVHVTNLPWKTVVKWFEDKRLQDGVPRHCSTFSSVRR